MGGQGGVVSFVSRVNYQIIHTFIYLASRGNKKGTVKKAAYIKFGEKRGPWEEGVFNFVSNILPSNNTVIIHYTGSLVGKERPSISRYIIHDREARYIIEVLLYIKKLSSELNIAPNSTIHQKVMINITFKSMMLN